MRLDGFRPLVLVDQEEAVAVRQAALHEGDLRAFASPGEAELRGNADRPQACFGAGTDQNLALADAGAAASWPEPSDQRGIFRLVICQRRRAFRRASDHRGATFHQRSQLAQHRQGHPARRAAEVDRAVAGAARSDQFRTVVRQGAGQRIGIDEVPCMGGWRIGHRALDVKFGQRAFLAIEIGQVRHVAPLLQHQRSTRQVVDPRPGHFAPGFVAAEVLSEHAEREARNLVIHWLVDRGVDHRAVHAIDIGQVDDPLQIGRSMVPEGCRGCQCLAGDEGAAIDVGDRSRALDVGHVGRARAGIAAMGPHRGHRDIRVRTHGHVVAQ